jgi:hypothetical protein
MIMIKFIEIKNVIEQFDAANGPQTATGPCETLVADP